MKLSELKQHLQLSEGVNFMLPEGAFVPEHFHVTEVGLVTKDFIDCGGTMRSEKLVSLQLWNTNDFDHRLKPQKLLNIIALSEKKLGIDDPEIEVEYQSGTIGKYGLRFNGKNFVLTNKQTACLAGDSCGVPQEQQSPVLPELKVPAYCSPKSGCC